MINFILLLLMFSDCSAIAKLKTYNNNQKQQQLIEGAVNISSTYYIQHFVTTVIWKQNESNCVDGFLKNYPGTVVLSPWRGDNDDQIRDINETVGFRQTIYFASTLHEYIELMKLLNDVTRFPILFILVLENTISTDTELSAYIEDTWKNDQADIVIISVNEAQEVILSTFFPYSNGVCGNYTPVNLNFGDNMFPKKFTNFYQCPIRIAMLQYLPYVTAGIINGTVTSIGGYDGDILMIILNKLNATLEISSVDSYEFYGSSVNGTATGYIADLASEKADILIPADILTEKRYSVTLPSHISRIVDIRWVGPKQRPVHDWFKVIIPDKTNFTPLHGITLVLFIAVVVLIRKCKPHLTKGKSSVLYQSFIILLGQSVKFVTKSPMLNSLFILWIWFCFIFRIDYQADLVDALQTINLEPPFESFGDAITKVNGYGGGEAYLDYYRNTSVERAYKVIPMHEINEYIRRIYEGEKFLLATDVSLVQEITKNIQILEKRISMTGAVFYMRPGWPAVYGVDDIIVSLVEGGLIKNVLANSYETLTLTIQTDNDSDPKGLSLSVVNTCFYGLALMWATCFIVLIIEIIYHKKKSKKQHRWVN